MAVSSVMQLTLLCWYFSVSGLVAEQFLECTATQLSYHGLCELNTKVKEGELSVFFRNNHFSTMIKHKVRVCVCVRVGKGIYQWLNL